MGSRKCDPMKKKAKGIYKTETKKNQSSTSVQQTSRTVCGNWCRMGNLGRRALSRGGQREPAGISMWEPIVKYSGMLQATCYTQPL